MGRCRAFVDHPGIGSSDVLSLAGGRRHAGTVPARQVGHRSSARRSDRTSIYSWENSEMRDSTITALAVGGSEIAALVGLDPNRDAFSVYAEKLGLVEPAPPTPRMRMGKKLERIIAEVYAEETGQCIAWCDRTMQHVDRSWQVFTIDAFVLATESPTGGQIVSNMLRYPTPPLTLHLGLAEYN